MANIVVTGAAASGKALTTQAAASGGDTLVNDGQTLLYVNNGSAASVNVTITAAKPCSHGFMHDEVIAVPAGVNRYIGPFPPARFGTAVNIEYSAVTTVTVGAIKV